jgi:hypothetical protein
MSLLGAKRTASDVRSSVAMGSKPDMTRTGQFGRECLEHGRELLSRRGSALQLGSKFNAILSGSVHKIPSEGLYLLTFPQTGLLAGEEQNWGILCYSQILLLPNSKMP